MILKLTARKATNGVQMRAVCATCGKEFANLSVLNKAGATMEKSLDISEVLKHYKQEHPAN